MKGINISLPAVIPALLLSVTINSCNRMKVEWTDLVPLPPVPPDTVQPGVAGPFAGLHGNTLVVAGGANFPDTMPWNGGKKQYHNEIFLLQFPAAGNDWRLLAGDEGLDLPVAYGASASVNAGVVCLGGETENGMTDNSFIISVAGEKVLKTPLPPLPVPLSGAAATSVGPMVYIAGGVTPEGPSKGFWRLDTEDIGMGWKRLSDLPLSLINSVMVAVQGREPAIWILGGRTREKGDDMSAIRSEIFSYSLSADSWKAEGRLAVGDKELKLAAGTGAAVNENQIAIFGGNDGSVFNKVEAILSEMAAQKDSTRLGKLREEYILLQEGHPGFSRDLVILETETRKCFLMGEIPGPAQVTTTAVTTPWGIVIPSGEVKPGVRTTTVRMAKFRKER